VIEEMGDSLLEPPEVLTLVKYLWCSV
jgi:hypothetical protein